MNAPTNPKELELQTVEFKLDGQTIVSYEGETILKAAKVKLTLREFPTLNHGFFSYTAISHDSLVAAQLMCSDLKSHFELSAKILR